MNKLSAKEVLKIVKEKDYDNSWFIGQRKWSSALAHEVLAAEKKIRENVATTQSEQNPCGLVFLCSLEELNETLIQDCDRIYVFNSEKQFTAIQLSDNSFYSAVYKKSEDDQFIHPVHISRSKDFTTQNRYSFASLLGSIPDLKEHPITVWQNTKNFTWRFSHE
ncbi:MAG: hypothetical protein LHW41_05605 [Candidatus Cloacimonetes bacterium]|jgi:hypothetical protein|nr:hypothetical protein [Candidatus Cloacimonadota bacterium]